MRRKNKYLISYSYQSRTGTGQGTLEYQSTKRQLTESDYDYIKDFIENDVNARTVIINNVLVLRRR